jgi:hypothetical protein
MLATLWSVWLQNYRAEYPDEIVDSLFSPRSGYLNVTVCIYLTLGLAIMSFFGLTLTDSTESARLKLIATELTLFATGLSIICLGSDYLQLFLIRNDEHESLFLASGCRPSMSHHSRN